MLILYCVISLPLDAYRCTVEKSPQVKLRNPRMSRPKLLDPLRRCHV